MRALLAGLLGEDDDAPEPERSALDPADMMLPHDPSAHEPEDGDDAP